MEDVEKDLNKVRYRNEGEEFHVLWAARRALRLIDPQSDLVAVSIEGISEKEESGTKAGLLVVDMTEYFGSEPFDEAKKIIYCQLKHSTIQNTRDWSAGELKEVVEGFAARFKELITHHSLELVKKKVQFRFITNRPISANIRTALFSSLNKNITGLMGYAAGAFETLKKAYGSEDGNFEHFLSLLVLDDKQARSILRILKLEKSNDERIWSRKSDNSKVMRSELWGTWARDDREERSNHGRRLVARIDFILEMLTYLVRDLIIQVQINRADRSKEVLDYVPPYTRLFVLKSNGTLHVLEGSRQIRDQIGWGTKT